MYNKKRHAIICIIDTRQTNSKYHFLGLGEPQNGCILKKTRHWFVQQSICEKVHLLKFIKTICNRHNYFQSKTWSGKYTTIIWQNSIRPIPKHNQESYPTRVALRMKLKLVLSSYLAIAQLVKWDTSVKITFAWNLAKWLGTEGLWSTKFLGNFNLFRQIGFSKKKNLYCR